MAENSTFVIGLLLIIGGLVVYDITLDKKKDKTSSPPGQTCTTNEFGVTVCVQDEPPLDLFP